MPTDPRGFHVDGPAGLALVDRVLDELERLWLTAAEVPVEDRILFGLALSEITTNIAQHNVDAEVTVNVAVRVIDGALRADITDSAPPAAIDWEAVSMPEEESESGRGLALSRAVLDEFTHTADERGNRWLLQRRVSVSEDPDT